jgi:hypothetical protein
MKYSRLAGKTFEPVSGMLDSGQCEPLTAAVHGLLLAAVALCATYNTAAWLKRRQPHLAINAIIYCGAVWWEHSHVMHHLADCPRPAAGGPVSAHSTPNAGARDAA